MAYSIYSKAGTDEAISSALADSLPTAPADIGAATAAQGALADTAVQPEDLGTAAAADAGDFATAAQGAKADASDVDQITLTGDLVLTLPAGHPAEQVYRCAITQGGAGGYTVTYGGSPVTVDLAANAVTEVELWPVGAGYEVRYPGRVTPGLVQSKAKADGTDQTVRIQGEIDALMAAGGGTLVLPVGTITLNGTLTLVNDGATPPKQAALTLKGQGAHWSGRGTAPVGGTILDIKGTDTYGKLKTNGLGLLTIESVTFRDTSGGATPFLYTTNTTLHVNKCAFVGSKTGPACDQDVIILGGKQQVEGFAGWDDGFQGYGTAISDSFFSGIRRGVVGQAFANSVKVSRLTAWTTCGNTAGGFIEWDGRPGTGGQVAAGGTISDCLIEMPSYQYGIVLRYTIGMDLRGNSFYDFGASSIAGVLLEATATGNRVVNGASATPTKQSVVDLSGNNSVLSVEDGVPARWGNQTQSFVRATAHGSGAMSMDLYSGNLAYTAATAQSGGYGQLRLVTRTGVQYADGVTTAGSTTLTSATAAFAVGDLGMSVSGTGIPNGTTICRVVSTTQAVMTKAATATATGVTFRVARPEGGTVTDQVSFGRQHWCALGSAPAAAAGANAGTGATATVAGVDVAGRLSITTGTTPTAGALGIWTPAISYKTIGRVVITARNAATAALLAGGSWVSGTGGAQTINTIQAPAASTLYEIDYLVIES